VDVIDVQRGALKMQDMKMQDTKMQDMKMQDMKMQHTGSSHVSVIKLEQSSNVHDMTNTANCQVTTVGDQSN